MKPRNMCCPFESIEKNVEFTKKILPDAFASDIIYYFGIEY